MIRWLRRWSVRLSSGPPRCAQVQCGHPKSSHIGLRGRLGCAAGFHDGRQCRCLGWLDPEAKP